MDLDSLLDASAPAVAPRDTAMRQELTSLVDAAETSVRPHRHRRRFAIVGGLAAAVLAVTVATTAAVAPKAWTSWIGDDHTTCQMEIGVGPAGPDALGGEPNMWPDPFPYARRDRMVDDARSFVNSFDYAGIDREQAIGAWQVEEDKVIADEIARPAGKPGEAPDGPQPRLTGDDLTSMALASWMHRKLDEHLTAEGYDMSTKKGSDRFLLMESTGTSCK